MTRKTQLYLILALMISIASCGKEKEVEAGQSIFTSILPQKYFVERIAGDTFKINVLVGPGKNPATYEPTPEQVIKLSNSSILFTIGVPFEKSFLKTIKSGIKKIKIIDTSREIKKRHFKVHSHGKQSHHHEGEVEDPHTWLSPQLAQQHATNIYNALVVLKPKKKKLFQSNYEKLIKDLKNLHKKIHSTLTPMRGSEILVFHPAFGYFTDEYGLKQQAIEMGGKSPSPKILTQVIDRAKKNKIKVIFVQPEFSRKSAQAIAKAIGGVVISLNPLSPNYMENLAQISQKIGESQKR